MGAIGPTTYSDIAPARQLRAFYGALGISCSVVRHRTDRRFGWYYSLKTMRSLGQTDPFPLLSVLIVDADPDSRELYALMLSDVAHEIQLVDDGRVALARALAHPPDLLITESRIPYIAGCPLCRILRSDPTTARVPIILLTAQPSLVSADHARSVGANAVLLKPFLMDAFIQTIKHVLDACAADGADPDPISGVDRNVGTAMARTRQRSRSSMKSHSYERYVTTLPPRVPPPLRCPTCDCALVYVRSQVGGVSATNPEQWDLFECPANCGSFEYRQRTKFVKSLPRPA